MPRYDFKKPMTLDHALEQYALAYQCVMTALRDEVKFGEGGDAAELSAAQLLCSMFEDGLAEARVLTNQLERRIAGMSPA